MKNTYAILFILLSLYFLNLDGMSEQRLVANQFNSEDTPEIEQAKSYAQPYRLKTLTALKIYNLIKDKKASAEIVKDLPEELQEFIHIFKDIDQCLNTISITLHAFYLIKTKTMTNETWSKFPARIKKILQTMRSKSILVYKEFLDDSISEELKSEFTSTKRLLYALLDAESPQIITFISALKEDLFYFCPLAFFKSINLLLSRKLSSIQNARDIDSDPKVIKQAKLDQPLLQDDNISLIEKISFCALAKDMRHVITLLLDLNILERSYLLGLFSIACNQSSSDEMIKFLKEKTNLTRDEFASMLTPIIPVQHSSLMPQSILEGSIKNLNKLKYLFQLMEEWQLPIKEIINNQNYRCFNNLLNIAILDESYEISKFLLDQGSDPKIPLIHGTAGNSLELAKQLKSKESIIKLLEEALSKES